jgi:hypothetical protein
VGLLAGAGALAILGVGPSIAVESVMADGLGVGGTAGVSGALVGLGIPEHEAMHYEGRLQKGGSLASSNSGEYCDSTAKKSQDNLKSQLNYLRIAPWVNQGGAVTTYRELSVEEITRRSLWVGKKRNWATNPGRGAIKNGSHASN